MSEINRHQFVRHMTLGMKNLMGTVLDRNTMRALGLPQSITYINTGH